MKQFINTVVLIIALLTGNNPLFAQNKSAKQPNIILIVADDLGYGDVGCYGQQKTETPNIDRLAKQGLLFRQFYAGTSVCAPSRASLLTGLHTGHTAVRGNKGMKPEGQYPLPESSNTISAVLQQQGYTTAAFGKWGLGFITTSGDPQKKGFDEFYGYNCQTLAHNYYPDHLWNNHERIDFEGNTKSDSAYSADVIHEQAMRFLRAKHDKPFFLFLPYTLPHGDVVVPHDSTYNYYVKKFSEQPAAPKKENDPGRTDVHPHAAFAAMVTRLDKYVGDVMKAVEQEGMAQNTLIIFTSDNGPHREHGGDPEYFNGSGGFRGIKRDLYEGGIRVPFIACWKGHIKPGTTTEQPATFWDLFPTFQQMAGMPVSKQVDGLSVLPTLLGTKGQQQHKYLYWEFHESGGRQAVRFGDWKGVRLNVSTQANSPVELYNLKNDPSEKNNVAGSHPGIVQQVEAFMKEAHVPAKDWPLLFEEIKNDKQETGNIK